MCRAQVEGSQKINSLLLGGFLSLIFFLLSLVLGPFSTFPFGESHQEGGPEITSCHCLLLTLKEFFAHLDTTGQVKYQLFQFSSGQSHLLPGRLLPKPCRSAWQKFTKVLTRALDTDLTASFWLMGSLLPSSFPPDSPGHHFDVQHHPDQDPSGCLFPAALAEPPWGITGGPASPTEWDATMAQVCLDMDPWWARSQIAFRTLHCCCQRMGTADHKAQRVTSESRSPL